MVLKVVVAKVDSVEVTLDVTNDDQTKQLTRTYASLDALYGLVSKWYPRKPFLKPANPNGLMGDSIPDTQIGVQKFFDVILRELGDDNFPVKAFFRLYDLRGKVAIVTGASSGIGQQNAYQLAEMGAHVFLGCRNEAKTLPIIEDIKKKSGNPNVEFVKLDLVSLQSVKEFAEAFKAKNLPLHILINNAGTIQEGLTDYGVDMTFGTNHVAVFFLTICLIDVLKKTEGSRIVVVASKVANDVEELSFDKVRTKIPVAWYNPTESYALSKFANILCVKWLYRLLSDGAFPVNVYAVHPGVVGSGFWRNFPAIFKYLVSFMLIGEEEGSWMTLYCAVAEGCKNESGYFYNYELGFSPVKPQPQNAEKLKLQERCWEETEKMCGLRS